MIISWLKFMKGKANMWSVVFFILGALFGATIVCCLSVAKEADQEMEEGNPFKESGGKNE